MSASQSSGSPACLELPLRKPLDEDSLTPLLKWSTSMSTSLLGGGHAGTSGTPALRTGANAALCYLLRFCWLRLPFRLISDGGGVEPAPAGGQGLWLWGGEPWLFVVTPLQQLLSNPEKSNRR